MPHLPLFATPLSMYDLPSMDEINRDLTARLVAESVSLPSVHHSNVGGWHSQNLAGRPEVCFRNLLQCIVTRVRETVEGLAKEREQGLPAMRIGVHAGAMVMRNGDYTIPHDHSEVHWATVYYADAGDADEGAHPASGLLALVDPQHGGRPMPGLDLGTTFTMLPRSGRLVVFPGRLLHSCTPTVGSGRACRSLATSSSNQLHRLPRTGTLKLSVFPNDRSHRRTTASERLGCPTAFGRIRPLAVAARSTLAGAPSSIRTHEPPW